MRRKLCVVTGTRAEYGLLYWIMQRIVEDPDLELQLVVTGMHLSSEFGLTYRQIESDGFVIHEKVEMLLSSDTPQAITKSVGLGTIGFADSYARLQPDIVVVLGDRFEIFAAAQAAMFMGLPIAHIHGGELTEGAIDDSIRHAITKMAHIHFTAAEEYRNRVIQLGEQPKYVFNVGALGVEGIRNFDLYAKSELAQSLNISVLKQYIVITLHPTTLDDVSSEEQVQTLLQALDQYQDYQMIFTKANADADGRIINMRLAEYVANHGDRCYLFDSLGQIRYLSTLKHAAAAVGNSSSGIIEAPVLGVPTVNIGIRQQGRIKANSIIDCTFDAQSIRDAIHDALSEDMKLIIENMDGVYGHVHTSKMMKEILKEADLSVITRKQFHNLLS